MSKKQINSVEDVASATLHYMHGKKFLILGLESEKYKCNMKIVTFIKTIIDNYWNHADLFLELPYYEPNKYKIYQYLQQYLFKREEFSHGFLSLYKEFKACVPMYKKSFLYKCPFGTVSNESPVKVHVVDLLNDPTRIKNKTVKIFVEYFYKIIEVFDWIDTIAKGIQIDAQIKLEILSFRQFILIPGTKQELLHGLKIESTIKKISNEDIRTGITNWFNSKWDEAYNNFTPYTYSENHNIEFDTFKRIGNSLLDLFFIFNDTYTMARVFAQAYNKRDTTNDNFLLYVNDMDAYNCREILNKIGAQQIVEIKSEEVSRKSSHRCINLRPIVDGIKTLNDDEEFLK